MNFLKETIEELERNGKSKSDIKWIGTKEKKICLENFFNDIDFDYDDGYGGNEIPLSLYIVGEDWWLERREYDGAEWWDFKTIHKEPKVECESYDDLWK